jgi:RNA polymerase sigma-70 factor (ECF subfamily)
MGGEPALHSDGELVRRARSGDRSSGAELVRRWAGRVTAVCHARVGRQAADDLAQETLLRAFQSLAELADPEKFGPWIHGIAVRVCLDWRKNKRRTEVPLSALSDIADQIPCEADAGSSALERAEETNRLLAAVETLPDECREALLLYYYGDVTYADLAAMLGVSIATINARLTKARVLLRARMVPDSTR